MTTSNQARGRFGSKDQAPDVVVVGAGLIGLAIALELHDRGAFVTVVERGRCLGGASSAAAGMLAAEDPNNPPELLPLSRLSVDLYLGFLRRIESFSGMVVPFQTDTAIQHFAGGPTVRLAERSVDPRQLGAALLAGIRLTSIRLLEDTRIVDVDDVVGGITLRLGDGGSIAARAVVYAMGAWTSAGMAALGGEAVAIAPRKGQMLRVRVPSSLDLSEVHRSEGIYIVPRTLGPQAGTAVIGATVEDAGFDTSVRSEDLRRLRVLAAELVPQIGSEADAPMVEAWAGLRPATADFLPVLGPCERDGHFIASGHYRNGILLAPATAVVLADLVEGNESRLELDAFSVGRFSGGSVGAAVGTAQDHRYSPSSK
jgi:glycine oxidase